MIGEIIEKAGIEDVYYYTTPVAGGSMIVIKLRRTDPDICTTTIAYILKKLDEDYEKLKEEFERRYEHKILEKLRDYLRS